MPVSTDLSALPLRVFLRPALALAPEDSLTRFVHLTRALSATLLPVVRNNRLCGMMSLDDVLPILNAPSPEARESALERPVSEVMRPPAAVATPQMTPEEVGRLCAEHRLSLIPLVEPDGYFLGVLLASDLLAPDEARPRPAVIGGMATPFGVYLTNGSLQAGAGNLALMATGALMAVLFTLSQKLVEGALWLAHRYAGLPYSPIYNLDYTPPAQQPWLGLLSLALMGGVFALFLLLLRATRLAGFHAAEHQTVHAIERNENLTPEIVRRMPRAHPRCGTNLVAAGLLFGGLSAALAYIPQIDMGMVPVLAGIVTLVTWRTVGTFLQERFTTKPAHPREIASGIAAGEELLEKYQRSLPGRPRPLRRLWCMGLVQIVAGSAATLLVLTQLERLWNLWHP
jgi:CBS domain-containing protein